MGELDYMSVMTVGEMASEEDGQRIWKKTGLTNVQFPAVAIRSLRNNETDATYAFNQLGPMTLEYLGTQIKSFFNFRDKFTNIGRRCHVSRNSERDHYTPEIIERYDEFAEKEKVRLALSDEIIREVDEASFRRQLKKSWKDVLIIYTARWCSYSTRLEEIMHRMARAGEFEDLDEELQIVKIDVVRTEAKDFKTVNQVPQMKYVSARYKDFPNWYGGPNDDPDALVQFVRSYHSMRHV